MIFPASSIDKVYRELAATGCKLCEKGKYLQTPGQPSFGSRKVAGKDDWVECIPYPYKVNNFIFSIWTLHEPSTINHQPSTTRTASTKLGDETFYHPQC